MLLLDRWSVGVVQRLPLWLIAFFDHHHRLRQIRVVSRADWTDADDYCRCLHAVACRACRNACSPRSLSGWDFCSQPLLLPGPDLHDREAADRTRASACGRQFGSFLYPPLGWNVEYASLPSGHATDAFAAATALGLLWPKMRPLMWTYAVMIAVSRVALTAHFPSDVLAGRNRRGRWHASYQRTGLRRAGWPSCRPRDGRIHAMSGPSFARIRRVARQLIAP